MWCDTSVSLASWASVMQSMPILSFKAGIMEHITIFSDGSITWVRVEGLRFPYPGNEAVKIEKTGQVSPEELRDLVQLFDNPLFNEEAEYDAYSSIKRGSDYNCQVSLYYQEDIKTLMANYPLSVDFRVVTDVADPVKAIFQELNYIAEYKTEIEARDLIACE